MAYEALNALSGGDDIFEEQDRQLETQADIYKINHRVALTARKARPKNTNRSYGGPQKEWKAFCREYTFPDGEMVTEQKLVYFLDKVVINRPIRASRYLQARTDLKGGPVVQTLGKAGVKMYVNSIVDLWNWQRALGTNTHPNPRGHLVRALLRTHHTAEDERRRKEYIDRGLNTLQDSYTQENIRALVRYCWTGWKEDDTKKGRKPQAQESYFRTAVDFLFSHSMLLRGEDVRALQLPDMFTIQMDEGPTPCWPMIIMKSHGKTNQFGHIEYMGVMRHKEPLLCTISQTAFYLFYRWDIIGEPVPQFYQRQQWYDWHLFRGSAVDKAISYETQVDWIGDIFKATGLTSKKKTHSGRSGGARLAELNGVDDASIRRAGHWNQDAMSNCYLSGLPRKFLRTLAGFNPEDQGNYYLPRATIPPPESLVRALWPWVDTWLSWFNEDSLAQGIDPELLGLPSQPPLIQKGVQQIDQKDLAAQGFLRLLDQLRTVIIQDAVLLQIEIPNHKIWNHPLFHRIEFKQFAQQLQQSIHTTTIPYEIQLRQTLPILADRITTAENNLHQNITSNHHAIEHSLRSLHHKVDDLISGRISFTVRANGTEMSPGQLIQAVDAVQPLAREEVQPESMDMIPDQSQQVPTAPFLEMPSYTLSRTINTVRELWTEWTIGLNGQPAVQALEQEYGARWRADSKERVMFGRRKIIIDEIYARTKDGTPAIEAVEALELTQARMKCSLAKLAEFLKEARTKPCI